LEALEDRRLLSAGQLDPTFGPAHNGRVTTDLNGHDDVAGAVTLQFGLFPVVAGVTTNNDDPDNPTIGIAVARYLPGGGLDPTFGANGIATAVFDDWPGLGRVTGVATQPDGKIVVVGDFINERFANFFGVVIVRFTYFGQLDPTFDNDGRVEFSPAGMQPDGSAGLVLLPNGKILVAGSIAPGDVSALAVTRFNGNGSLDTSFGTGGTAYAEFTGTTVNFNATASGIALAANGKIIVAGTVQRDDPLFGDFALARFNSNGNLDNSFSGNGKVATHFGADEQAYDVALDDNGKLIVVGRTGAFGAGNFALARYNTNGSLDTSFSMDGRVITDFAGNDDVATTVAIDKNGRIVVGGLTTNADFITSFALARYNTNGSLNAAFGTLGKVTTTFSQGPVNAFANPRLVIDVFNRIVMAGTITSDTTFTNDFALARYLGDISPFLRRADPPPDDTLTSSDRGTDHQLVQDDASTSVDLPDDRVQDVRDDLFTSDDLFISLAGETRANPDLNDAAGDLFDPFGS
jgi:uncharacterized delta-60 repeat protein